MSVVKHVGVLTTRECTLMVTVQNTIPKVHGNNETSTNSEIKCEIYYTSNLLTIIFTVVPCTLMLSKSFIYQLMHNRVALKEY